MASSRDINHPIVISSNPRRSNHPSQTEILLEKDLRLHRSIHNAPYSLSGTAIGNLPSLEAKEQVEGYEDQPHGVTLSSFGDITRYCRICFEGSTRVANVIT
jgi:hypothetical protein